MIRTEDLDYSFGSTQMRGQICFDDTNQSRRPGILICHEWWGLNDYIRRRAQQLAELGYAAMALDMYGERKTTSNPEEAGKLMNSLMSNPEARGRVQAAFDAFTARKEVDANKIAAIGYCMGGSMALHMARAGMPLRGVACFHGGLKAEQPAQPKTIKAKILICTGADDPMVPFDAIKTFDDEMRRAGADYQIHIYGHTKHAFTNPNADKAGLAALKYNPVSDRRAWESLLDFLKEIFA